MDVDDTPQQTKIPAQHTSKPLPRGEASNTTDQATLRKDNTNDDLINHAHLPPALPSSPPFHLTSPPQQLPQQLPHLSANTKQALPPQHSTTSKDLANDKHLPPASLSSPLPLSRMEATRRQVSSNLRLTGQAMICWYQLRARDAQYAVGVRVWLYNPRKKRGFAPKL
ncbi:hypothetical protein E2C01_057698 [Portunus trituberculatus]|uniref:Uncharacterized protein n=1 Tax=Portunus trituberculatus TaxID=210409 RepID=A0A5B7H125_PORTR|nr:hypothetical protein [Portunus trituberculatus]